MDLITTLQALNACHGPSGDEREIAETLSRLCAPYVDDCRVDTLGNLIAHKAGRGPKVLFASHMDSVGFIVTHIEETGFLRLGRLGGITPSSVLHTPVRFRSGIKGLVAAEQGLARKALTLDDLYIDIGAADRAEAEGMVALGDTAVFDAPVFAAGAHKIVSPYLDNRISCVALLMAMETITQHENDLYFVFTAQEELGLRGARTAAYGIDPDYAIAVDVTACDDMPGAKHTASAVTGKGAGIKVMDHSVICHPAVVARLEALAAEHGIAAQRDMMRTGGTDAGAMHQVRAGVTTGGISIPCRYIHSPTELADRRDVAAAADLIAAFARAKLEV
ncbi:MAG: M20/M25/M40 family metallo-hydrolase [Oscillospiraceae bacterium]|nr:M20/M25/M40 family metallo-hydrolase [Oscillospiraceae bacterium]